MAGKKAPVWTVYGIYIADELRYVGMTKDMNSRRLDHEVKLFAFVRFEMRPISKHRDRAEACAAEKTEIIKRKPPMNRQYQNLGRGAYVNVKTTRVNGSGDHIPVTVRLRPGMMGVDQARAIWLANPSEDDMEALEKMTGWRIDHARNIFGPRSKKQRQN